MDRLVEKARADLSARLRARLPEIEDATLARVYGVADPGRTADPRYVEGLRATVLAAIDYGLESIELGERHGPLIPATLLAQARVAARHGVSLDTVLLRYTAGYTLLGEFLLEEASQSDLNGAVLERLIRTQGALFVRVVKAVSEEYAREGDRRPRSPEQRLAWRIERLVAGERIDTADIPYNFDAHHLGIVASGAGVDKPLRELANALDRRPLLIRHDEDTVWAWLGSPRPVDPAKLVRLAPEIWPSHLSLSIGEPATQLAGWRVTHRQAQAAHPVALRGPKSVVRYAEVPLLSSAFQDDLLVTSLRNLFIVPLERDREGGAVSKETLRAYIASERNASSTAPVLGVTRQTVINRLRTIEERLERPLHTCMVELEIALQLDELGGPTDQSSTGSYNA